MTNDTNSKTDNAPSFSADIQPLFTQMDRDHMLRVRRFDLWRYEDAKNWAERIYAAVRSGSMPPSDSEPEAPWSSDRVELFRRWIDGGCQP